MQRGGTATGGGKEKRQNIVGSDFRAPLLQWLREVLELQLTLLMTSHRFYGTMFLFATAPGQHEAFLPELVVLLQFCESLCCGAVTEVSRDLVGSTAFCISLWKI